MIVSVAMVSARPGHEAQVTDILNDYVTRERTVPGCMKIYHKRAIGNPDTFLLYAEYDTPEHFQASVKAGKEAKESGKIQFILEPHVFKAVFGNFD